MSCINRQVGNTPVEPGFAKVQGRPKWAIPWMEDDPGLTMPQLWAGRMRRDAADALQYGCTGLMGIHWRTRVLGPERLRPGPGGLGARRAGGARPSRPPTANRNSPPSTISIRLGPRGVRPGSGRANRRDLRPARRPPAAPDRLGHRPGSIRPDKRPWQQVRKEYAFVEELAALRPRIEGPGNLERFDYWLNNFRYLRAIAEVRCAWGAVQRRDGKVKAEKDPEARKKLAREMALPARKELVASVRRIAPASVGHGQQSRRNGQRVQLAAADAADVAYRTRARNWPSCWARTCRPTPCHRKNMPARRDCSCPRSARRSWLARRCR